MKRCLLTKFCILFALFCLSQTHSDMELLELSNLFSTDEMMFTSDTLSGAYHMPRHIVPNSSPFSHIMYYIYHLIVLMEVKSCF